MNCRYHFINMCFHESDFGLKVKECNYFASHHGKNICDGIGANSKRAVREASLRSIPIVNPLDMFTFLDNNHLTTKLVEL